MKIFNMMKIVLLINYKFIKFTKPISNGFVIANHKCWLILMFLTIYFNSFLIGKNNVKILFYKNQVCFIFYNFSIKNKISI